MPYTMPEWAKPAKPYRGREGGREVGTFRATHMKPRLEIRARELGHVMSDWIEERGLKSEGHNVESWVAQCDRCHLWMGLTRPDPNNEPDGTYGSCLRVECRGFGTKVWWRA